VTHQLQRAEAIAAQFVKKQYFVALEMLREHRALLDEVSQTLENKRYMTGEDFTVIWSTYVKQHQAISSSY
jgi:thiazole synthase ThiGH ThiG subunit